MCYPFRWIWQPAKQLVNFDTRLEWKSKNLFLWGVFYRHFEFIQRELEYCEKPFSLNTWLPLFPLYFHQILMILGYLLKVHQSLLRLFSVLFFIRLLLLCGWLAGYLKHQISTFLMNFCTLSTDRFLEELLVFSEHLFLCFWLNRGQFQWK